MPHQLSARLPWINGVKAPRLLSGKTTLALMATLLFLVFSAVRAEDWFQVAVDERRTVEVDRDSVRRVGTMALVQLRWRTKTSSSLTVSTGAADCARWVVREDERVVTSLIDKRTV